jgi:hypothetical protein
MLIHQKSFVLCVVPVVFHTYCNTCCNNTHFSISNIAFSLQIKYSSTLRLHHDVMTILEHNNRVWKYPQWNSILFIFILVPLQKTWLVTGQNNILSALHNYVIQVCILLGPNDPTYPINAFQTNDVGYTSCIGFLDIVLLLLRMLFSLFINRCHC